MAKRKMSENSLKNLETEKYKFSKDCPEIAQRNQIKSVEKRKENKAFAEACRITLNGCQDIALKDLVQDYLLNPDISAETKLRILQLLADYSGQKPKERIDTTIKTYSLFESETEEKAKALESEQSTKKIDKK